jgi:hypothetical protein
MINWEEIEKACMSLDKDCVPQNAREWDTFIRQYENCIEYYEGRGHDFTFDGMTENERQELVEEHMYLGRGFKKSVFECCQDLGIKKKKIFKGLNWNAVLLVKRIWTDANIDLYGLGLKSLPPCPRYVIGSFECSNNSLTSLEGAPERVGGDFGCVGNKLTSLEGAPEQVGGGFWCYNNKLTSLKGAPEQVGGGFDCSNNALTSLKGAPEQVGEGFFCYSNILTTLKGAPERVGGSFDCNGNSLTSLVGAPEQVGGRFWCGGNKLPKSIPDSFHGNDLHRYVGLTESFVMRWNEFNK